MVAMDGLYIGTLYIFINISISNTLWACQKAVCSLGISWKFPKTSLSHVSTTRGFCKNDVKFLCHSMVIVKLTRSSLLLLVPQKTIRLHCNELLFVRVMNARPKGNNEGIKGINRSFAIKTTNQCWIESRLLPIENKSQSRNALQYRIIAEHYQLNP